MRAKLLGTYSTREGLNDQALVTHLPQGRGMTSPFAPSLFTLTECARQHRKSPTRSEAMLWQALRDRRFRGVKFRREHVLHPFIVDFYAAPLKLVVEVDGGYHAARGAEDAARTSWLERIHGVRVLRFEAHRVERDLGGVLAELAAACR